MLLQTAVDVGIDFLIARATGTDFRLVDSLKVNAALNVTTLGIGSTVAKLRHLGKLATLASHADEAAEAARAAAQAARHADEVERAIRAAREAERPAEEIRRLFQEGLLSAIRPAGEWESLLQGVRQEAELEVHHLIEQRFAQKLGLDPGNIPSIILTKEQHRAFTNAWRKAIGYIGDRSPVTTANATLQDIWAAAQSIYADPPELLEAVRQALFGK